MTYKINILKNANDDLDWFRRNDKTSYIKSFDMTREMMIDPRVGTGKPERLKHFEKEVYSRRVNHKDRVNQLKMFMGRSNIKNSIALHQFENYKILAL